MDFKSQLDEYGYVVFKDFFSEEEINNIHSIIKNYFNNSSNHFFYHNCGKIIGNAVEYIPELHKVITKRLIQKIESVIGNVYYLHQCGVTYNTFNNWHRDISDNYIKNVFSNEELFKNCHIYKIGIYFEDHDTNLSGLSIKPKSHKYIEEKGEEFYIKSKRCDIVLFDQKIYHKGEYLNEEDKVVCKQIEKEFPTLMEIGLKKFEYFKQKRIHENNTRYAMFLGFGKKDSISKEFINNIVVKQNQQLNANYKKPSPAIKKHFENIGAPHLDFL